MGDSLMRFICLSRLMNTIFFNNSGGYGGLSSLWNCTFKLYGIDNDKIANKIYSNKASFDGGIIRSHHGPNIIEIPAYSFINNIAQYGGALSVFDNTNLKVYGIDNDAFPCKIQNNKARDHSGFIYLSNSNAEIHNCNFF